MPRLQDRIAIVTGAASGIGRAIALRYGLEGCKVVCADLTEATWRTDSPADEARDTTHARINASGGSACFIQCDVTDPASIEVLIKKTIALHGRLDIMVNNAGIAPEASAPAPIWQTSLDIYHKTLRVNLDGVYYCTRAAAAQMVSQAPLTPDGDRGWILNTCSVYGLVGTRSASAYATSKGGVASLTRSAALDCAPFGVHVNAVNPAYVRSALTDAIFRSEAPEATAAAEQLEAMHPMHGVGEPEDVTGAYVFLASEDARWVTGVSLFLCFAWGWVADVLSRSICLLTVGIRLSEVERVKTWTDGSVVGGNGCAAMLLACSQALENRLTYQDTCSCLVK